MGGTITPGRVKGGGPEPGDPRGGHFYFLATTGGTPRLDPDPKAYARCSLAAERPRSKPITAARSWPRERVFTPFCDIRGTLSNGRIRSIFGLLLRRSRDRGVALAQLDVNRGSLDHASRARIKEAVEWVIDDLSDHVDATTPTAEEDAAEGTALPSMRSAKELASSWQGAAVLCVAGHGSLDEAAAMLAQLLERRGISARVVPYGAVSVANLSQLDVTDVQMAYLSYL